MSDIKTIVETYLATDRSMSGARKLYLKYGLQRDLKVKLNRNEMTVPMMQEVQKELAKEAGVTDAEFKAIMAQKTSYWKKIQETEGEKGTGGETGVKDVNPLVDDKNLPVVVGKIAVVVGEPVKHAMHLRSEFPFLAEKDGPPVLKSLVGSLLSAYDAFRHGHADLFDAEGEKEQAEIAASVVGNYLENRTIWEELDHFKKTGKFLGKHPDVAKFIADSEVDVMDALKLSKEKINLEKSINKYENLIKDSKDAKKITNWSNLIEDKKYRLNRVNTRLEGLK